MPVGADHGGDGGHLLRCGAVGEHVPPRHESEFGRGEQPVADDELVGRAGPGCGGGPVGVHTGTAGGDEHHLALAGGDQRCGVEECGNAQRAGSPGTRSESQLKGDLRAVRPHDSVDLVRCDAGVGQRSERTHQGDGRRVVARQGPGLHGVADAGDGHVGERVWCRDRHERIVSIVGRCGPKLPSCRADAPPGLGQMCRPPHAAARHTVSFVQSAIDRLEPGAGAAAPRQWHPPAGTRSSGGRSPSGCPRDS